MSNFLLSALGVVCPSCDEYNEPGSAKCVSCGAEIGHAAAAAAPAAPDASAKRAPAPAASAALGSSDASGTASFAAPKLPAARPLGSPPPAVAPAAARAAAPAPAAGPKATDVSPPGLKPATRPAVPAVAPAGAKPGDPARPGAKPSAPIKFGLTVVGGPTAGQRFRLAGTAFLVGRSRGAILFAEDPFVSATHAAFMVKDGKLFVRDESSASGVYLAIAGQENIAPGTYFSTGTRLFRFVGALPAAPAVPAGRPAVYGSPVPQGQILHAVEEILVGGRAGKTVVSAAPLLTIGQGKCDLSYPSDEELATRHCELSPTPTGAVLRDLSGGLGTFVRISAGQERLVAPGERIRIGQQVLQVEAFA